MSEILVPIDKHMVAIDRNTLAKLRAVAEAAKELIDYGETTSAFGGGCFYCHSRDKQKHKVNCEWADLQKALEAE